MKVLLKNILLSWSHLFRVSSKNLRSYHGKVLAQEFSYEWLHSRILSTQSKVKTTFYTTAYQHPGKHCSVAIISMFLQQEFIYRLES